jgi:hypothetical protein
MKLVINGYKVKCLDMMFIALSMYFLVVSVIGKDWEACHYLLFVWMAVEMEFLRSKLFHLEKKTDETLPGDVQETAS